MKTSLLKGLIEQDAEEIKGQYIAALRLRRQYIKTLEEKIVSADNASLAKDAYGNASWPFLQADYIGYKRALNEVISLLSDE